MPDIICLGEPIVDMVCTQPANDLVVASNFDKLAGGAPLNVAAAAARLGASSGVICKAGGYYRYHVEDPIYFNKRIVVTIEHGHDNHRRDDWSSTAYWYQREPHDPTLFPKLLDKKGRKPRVHIAHMVRKTLCIAFIVFLLSVWFFL